MIETAYAMAPPPTGDQRASSPIAGMMPLILIFFVFYFLLIRPQKKQANEQKKMIEGLKKSDEVVTGCGIHGRISALKGKQIELEIAPSVKIIINKQAVSYKKPDIITEEKNKS
ncbi:preprotein translocase subunit YajC [Elusimicrobiota bacterium]